MDSMSDGLDGVVTWRMTLDTSDNAHSEGNANWIEKQVIGDQLSG